MTHDFNIDKRVVNAIKDILTVSFSKKSPEESLKNLFETVSLLLGDFLKNSLRHFEKEEKKQNATKEEVEALCLDFGDKTEEALMIFALGFDQIKTSVFDLIIKKDATKPLAFINKHKDKFKGNEDVLAEFLSNVRKLTNN